MKRKTVVLISSMLLLCMVSLAMGAGGPGPVTTAGEKVVRVSAGAYDPADHSRLIDLITTRHGARLRHDMESISCASYEILESQLETLLQDRKIARLASWVEKVGRCRIPANEYPGEIYGEWNGPGTLWTPNDPYYGYQWGPECIDAELAWNRRRGDKSIIVAIVDTGCDLDHSDLAANIDTSIDYDFVNNDATAEDDHGHGTHTAGICSAVIDNSRGVAGCFQTTIMAVKVLDRYGSGWWDDVAAGINWARNNGAHVVSMSLGGTGRDAAVESACQNAYNSGMLVCASAGNYGSSTPMYPATFKSVIGVGALQTCTQRASFSNYGFGDDTQEGNVEVMAPGVDIYSTYYGNSYTYMDGTSMSCPFVAAVCCGYHSFKPGWSSSQKRHHMQNHADYLGNQTYYGYGRIDGWPPFD